MIRPAEFEITEDTDGKARVVSLRGELDMNTVERVTAHLTRDLDADATGLTLDLRELAFMDSSGVRLLIELHHRSTAEGWELKLIAPRHEAAALVLRVTGADGALPFHREADR